MLDIKNISKTYKLKKGVPVKALKDISLSVEDKGMVFILGKSGSGKSTLLNLIGGLDFADSGEIVIDGKSTKDCKESDYDSYRNTYIGFVFQEYNILNEFTVGENILLALELQSKKGDKGKLEEILKEVDLEGYADRKPNELSGGQRQRVAIARAIIKDPKIIMADEPTGALDSETGKSIFDTLKRLSQDRLVIVVSHDREFAEEYGDRIIELADGEIISDERKTQTQGEHDSAKPLTVLKKSRLPYKRALAMGAKTLSRKRFRLAVTIILCFFSLLSFGLAVTALDYSGAKTEVDYLADMYQDAIFVSPSLLYEEKDKVNLNGASFNDLRKLKERIGIEFQGVSLSNYATNYNYYMTYNLGNGNYYSQNIQGALPASKELFDSLGYTLYGKLPENEEEFVITKYIYEKMALAGLEMKDPDTREEIIIYPQEIADIQLFLDKKLRLTSPLTGKPALVVGVVDTNFDPEGKFEVFKEAVEFDINGRRIYNLHEEFDNYLRYGYFNLAFVYPKAYQEWEDNAKKQLDLEYVRETTGSLYLDGNNNRVDFAGVAGEEFIRNTDKIMWIDGKGDRRELANNEIILGVDIALDVLFPNRFSNVSYSHNKKYFEDLVYWNNQSFDKDPLREGGAGEIALLEEAESISLQELEKYKDYCKAINYVFDWMSHFERNDKESYRIMDIDTMQEKHWRWSYASYLSVGENSYSKERIGGYNFNVTGRQSGRYIYETLGDRLYIEYRLTKSPATAEKINPKNFEIRYDDCLVRYLPQVDFVDDPVIAGVYFPYEGMPSDLVINNKMFDETVYLEKSIYSYFIAPKTFDNTALKEIVNSDYDFLQARGFKVLNHGVWLVSGFDNAFDILVPIFLGITGVLGLFSVLLMGSYIAASIASQRKQIGILRALGATKSDVFAIFANESAIIAFITIVLSVIGTLLTCIVFNAVISNLEGFTLNVLHFGILQVFLLALVSIGVAVLASVIPLYKLSKKKPVDSMQDR